jgi:transcription elongation factor GreA
MTAQDNEVQLTQSAYTEMQQELEHLRTVRRREVAELIAQARETELEQDEDAVPAFEAAKEQQYFLEGRILQLEQTLARAIVIDEAAVRASDTVVIGSTVVLEDRRGRQHTYRIVDRAESDAEAGKISQDSPIGAAVIGRRRGDTVEVVAPAGTQALRIKGLR